MMKKAMLIIGVSCAMALFGGDEERLEELEHICGFVPSDDLRRPQVIPTPDDIIVKYHISTNQLVADLKSIVMKYSLREEDKFKRWIRESAVGELGRYCGTNELAFLSTIMTNSSDYAQHAAMCASICILTHSSELVDLARGIITNTTVYSERLRGWTCCLLLDKCREDSGAVYITDSAIRTQIAALVVEQAGVNTDLVITIDRCACDLNPWYRHSQQRRDNLARLRPPGLTGRPKEIYDAAQRDAAQED